MKPAFNSFLSVACFTVSTIDLTIAKCVETSEFLISSSPSAFFIQTFNIWEMQAMQFFLFNLSDKHNHAQLVSWQVGHIQKIRKTKCIYIWRHFKFCFHTESSVNFKIYHTSFPSKLVDGWSGLYFICFTIISEDVSFADVRSPFFARSGNGWFSGKRLAKDLTGTINCDSWCIEIKNLLAIYHDQHM